MDDGRGKGMRHDSHILSDHLNVGLTRTQAEKLAQAVTARFEALSGATFADRCQAHAGRRDNGCDRVSAVSPGGWKEHHGNRSTIKVRGCDNFRRDALRIANEIAIGLGFKGGQS